MDIHTTTLAVEVYVRPTQLMEPIDAKLETLQRLEATGRIDDLSLHAWPEKITLSENTPYSDAIDAFERMEAWADGQEADIRPPFSVRTTTSTFTEETRTMLRTPVMCLAVYAGGQLANVFPHARGDDQYGVADAIGALRTGDLELFTFATESSGPPPDRCPACAAWLMNVQGIGVCQDCERVELGDSTRRTHGQRPGFVQKH